MSTPVDTRPLFGTRLVRSLRRAGSLFGSIRLSTKAILLSTALTTLVITAVFVTLSIEIRDETKQLLRDMLNHHLVTCLGQRSRGCE